MYWLVCLFHSSIAIIVSLETLIDDLPVIVNPSRLCHCMKLDKQTCDRIEQEHKENLWKQTREIAATWFDRHVEEPSWEEVIEILICMENIRHAKIIADKWGVKFKNAFYSTRSY